jgi:serine/threonine-protein kinase RsbW
MRMPSTGSAIEFAVEQLVNVADECRCVGPEEERADLEIALREALANAVCHGNENAPDRDVRVRCYGCTDRGFIVAIRDQGAGFDPEDVPDPRDSDKVLLNHGRGLFLMRKLMDHVLYLKGGREVVLFKACAGN